MAHAGVRTEPSDGLISLQPRVSFRTATRRLREAALNTAGTREGTGIDTSAVRQ